MRLLVSSLMGSGSSTDDNPRSEMEMMDRETMTIAQKGSDRHHDGLQEQLTRTSSGKVATSNGFIKDRYVIHDYRDHSHDPLYHPGLSEAEMMISDECGVDDSHRICARRGGVVIAFPEKLYYMLKDAEQKNFSDVVGWQPHGRCFLVRQPKRFVEEIVPQYFKQSKITSFQRQVNLYGFRRLTVGEDRGGYYHELFLRGRPDLHHQMARVRVKGTGCKSKSSPSTEPNFYSYTHCIDEGINMYTMMGKSAVNTITPPGSCGDDESQASGGSGTPCFSSTAKGIGDDHDEENTLCMPSLRLSDAVMMNSGLNNGEMSAKTAMFLSRAGVDQEKSTESETICPASFSPAAAPGLLPCPRELSNYHEYQAKASLPTVAHWPDHSSVMSQVYHQMGDGPAEPVAMANHDQRRDPPVDPFEDKIAEMFQEPEAMVAPNDLFRSENAAQRFEEPGLQTAATDMDRTKAPAISLDDLVEYFVAPFGPS